MEERRGSGGGAAAARLRRQTPRDFLPARGQCFGEDVGDLARLAFARTDAGDPVGQRPAIDDRAAIRDGFERAHP